MKRFDVTLLLPTSALIVLLCVAPHTQVGAQDAKDELIFRDYSLFIDGVPQAERVGSFNGRVVWFSLPQQGQFVLSSQSHEGYNFEKLAKLESNTISFKLDGKLYQWTSTTPILEGGGELAMWVWHDTGFQPQGCSKGFCAGSNSSFENFIEQRKREGSR